MDCKATKRINLICLLMLAVVVCSLFFFHLDPWRSTRIFDSYVNLIPFVFLGITLCMNHTRRSTDIWLGHAWTCWFILSRVFLGDPYLVRSTFLWFNYDCLACLFALSFAWGIQDGRRMRGLKLTSILLLVIMTVLCSLGIYAFCTNTIVSIPKIGGNFGLINRRLNILTHPNNTASVILFTLLLSIWLLASYPRKRWLWLIVGASTLLFLVTCALTTSRTCMIQIACFFGMLVALLILRHPPKWLRKRFLQFFCAFAVAAVIFLITYASFGWMLDGMNTLKTAADKSTAASVTVKADEKKTTTQAKSEQKTSSDKAKDVSKQATKVKKNQQVAERPLAKDLKTMTGRTAIYKRSFELLQKNPKMLWFGTVNRTELVENIRAANAHNAYLQVALTLGLPGVLLAVLFTLRVLWLSIRVFFCRFAKASLADLILACILPVLLISTITESMLFNDAVPTYNVIFFLAYGYLSETERRLHSA